LKQFDLDCDGYHHSLDASSFVMMLDADSDNLIVDEFDLKLKKRL
jgi:hypothetical protein